VKPRLQVLQVVFRPNSVSANLPNLISLARIAACPAVFVLALSTSPTALFWAFALFLAAALSDLWDGYLARKHGWITNLGKLLDPLADKLLMISTFIPFYMVSHRADPLGAVPFWGTLPLWVLIVVFGREIFVTAMRSWAARRGSVIPAGQSGKIKAFIQNIFSGSLLLWYALVRLATERDWLDSMLWKGWSIFHEVVTATTLAVALFLTIFSLVVYTRQYRALFRTPASAG
jgi:CDP-diacylglycerol--glycerol-3-phosphate 3-phosphatidyltransferase